MRAQLPTSKCCLSGESFKGKNLCCLISGASELALRSNQPGCARVIRAKPKIMRGMEPLNPIAHTPLAVRCGRILCESREDQTSVRPVAESVEATGPQSRPEAPRAPRPLAAAVLLSTWPRQERVCSACARAAAVRNAGKVVLRFVLAPHPLVSTPDGNLAVATAKLGRLAYCLKVTSMVADFSAANTATLPVHVPNLSEPC